ncbi:heme-binding protein 2 isoform X1 [Anguilla rostrata]|uniref:heme-binding protein 2 isoform X1 n=1 Tax=Anguilla rostrata TaxID=7938 RepID=UPI0030D1F1FD
MLYRACLWALVVLVLMVTAEAYVGNSSESSFCTETKECLLYDLVCKTDEYEVRHYSPTKWVSTDEESFFMEAATTKAFRKLYKYITGTNEQGVKIDMTAPVVVKMKEKPYWHSSVYTLSFLLPSAYQESPPTPTNSEVYFTDMPDMNVYVRSYGGYMFSMIVNHHSGLLKKDLDQVQASYEQDFHYAVGYDSPMKFLNRHNEIWYQVVGEPVCTAPQK